MARTVVDTPIGPLGLVASGSALPGRCLLRRASGSARRAARLSSTRRRGSSRPTSPASSSDFDLPLELDGTGSSGSCWLALATIPYGQTVSYGEQARRLGLGPSDRRGRSARRTAQNPLPIVLPCHRVIGADGSLTGFGGGLHVKRFLLELEGALLPRRTD